MTALRLLGLLVTTTAAVCLMVLLVDIATDVHRRGRARVHRGRSWSPR